MKIRALFIFGIVTITTYAVIACSASVSRSECTTIDSIVNAPRKFDGKQICIQGYVFLDRHHMQIVESKTSRASIVLDIPKRAERSGTVQQFIQIVYKEPLSTPWRGVHATFSGVLKWYPDRIPRYVMAVDDIFDIEDQTASEVP